MTLGISQKAEFILAILEEDGECKTSYIHHIVKKYADVKTALNSLMALDLVKCRALDKKTKLYSLTDTGREYIEQVEKIYDNTRKES